MGTILGRDVIFFPEIFNFPCNPDCQTGCVEPGDRPHTADTLTGRAPERLRSDAVGTHGAYPGNNNATFHNEGSAGGEAAGDSVSIRGFLTCKGTSCE